MLWWISNTSTASNIDQQQVQLYWTFLLIVIWEHRRRRDSSVWAQNWSVGHLCCYFEGSFLDLFFFSIYIVVYYINHIMRYIFFFEFIFDIFPLNCVEVFTSFLFLMFSTLCTAWIKDQPFLNPYCLSGKSSFFWFLALI